MTEGARFTTLTSTVWELTTLTTGRFTTLGRIELAAGCCAKAAPVDA
jgi:hypothetical protein